MCEFCFDAMDVYLRYALFTFLLLVLGGCLIATTLLSGNHMKRFVRWFAAIFCLIQCYLLWGYCHEMTKLFQLEKQIQMDYYLGERDAQNNLNG